MLEALKRLVTSNPIAGLAETMCFFNLSKGGWFLLWFVGWQLQVAARLLSTWEKQLHLQEGSLDVEGSTHTIGWASPLGQ